MSNDLVATFVLKVVFVKAKSSNLAISHSKLCCSYLVILREFYQIVMEIFYSLMSYLFVPNFISCCRQFNLLYSLRRVRLFLLEQGGNSIRSYEKLLKALSNTSWTYVTKSRVSLKSEVSPPSYLIFDYCSRNLQPSQA